MRLPLSDTQVVTGTTLGMSSIESPELFREQFWHGSSIESTLELFSEQLSDASSVKLTFELFRDQLLGASSVKSTVVECSGWCIHGHVYCLIPD